jgi:hypothetical protein
MKPTISDKEIFERDWLNSPEVLVICRREDGSIAIHQWGLNQEDSCVLAMQAFQYNIAPLFRTESTVSTSTYKKVPSELQKTGE